MDSCVNNNQRADDLQCYVVRPDQGGGAELCGSLASGTFSYFLLVKEGSSC